VTIVPSYNLAINDQGEGSVSFILGGVLQTVPSTHREFKRITSALINGEDPQPFLDLAKAVEGLDGRVKVLGDTVYFGDEPQHSTLARTILRYRQEGRETKGLVLFMERLAQNPSRRSREQLFDWVQDRDLTIDAEGFFIAFKGVQAQDVVDSDDEGDQIVNAADGERVLVSLHAGRAIVNGVEIVGHIPNAVGDVITMPRPEVQDDPNHGCSTGLHAGTYDYAVGYASRGALLEVRIDPADVVSVPTDSGFQKLRTCRYEVLAIQDIPQPDVSHYEPTGEFYEDLEDEIYDALKEDVPRTFLDRLFGRNRDRS
jgi:hypothetical protein